MTALQTEYWTYKPKLIPSFVFEPLLVIMKEYCSVLSIEEKRVSCLFNDIQNKGESFEYSYIPSYNWNDAPTILHEICKIVENYTREKYDYVLVHIYPTGSSGINYHFDSEALSSSIASISLGATRKFRFRKIGKTKGWDTELKLNNGDLVWMHGPSENRLSCQNIYLHSVPVEKKVKNPRINLTFRQY